MGYHDLSMGYHHLSKGYHDLFIGYHDLSMGYLDLSVGYHGCLSGKLTHMAVLHYQLFLINKYCMYRGHACLIHRHVHILCMFP